MGAAIESQGVVIKRGDGATPTEAFASIGSVTEFSGPDGSATVIDTSDLSDTAKTKLMGLKDEGQVSFGGNFDPVGTGQVGLQTDRTNRTLRNFQIVLTDDASTTIEFSAYVLSFSIDGSVDDKISYSVTLEVSGEVVWDNAA